MYIHIHTHTCTHIHIHTHTYTYIHIRAPLLSSRLRQDELKEIPGVAVYANDAASTVVTDPLHLKPLDAVGIDVVGWSGVGSGWGGCGGVEWR